MIEIIPYVESDDTQWFGLDNTLSVLKHIYILGDD